MDLPNDPIMLMSVLNTYLRDEYNSLDALCDDAGLDQSALCRRLEAAGFTYMPQANQFR